MCGINLTFGRSKIELMNAALAHRGIRSSISELGNGMILGHVRLPIQGTSTDHDHPMTYKNLTGAFVGEVFNYKDFGPIAQSDLPIILREFHKRGIKCFKEFDGFWSAIIRDNYTGHTHVITDYLAKKPLYLRPNYLGHFGISSEITPLLHLGKVTPNELYFSAVAKWGYCPTDDTPFNEIRKLPEGSHWILDNKGQIIYADYHDKLVPRKIPVSAELDKAVENRLVSDVPISLLMSGGLDSTIIYSLLRQYTDELTIFHVDNDEAKYLEYIPFRNGDKLIKLDINPDDYDLDDVLLSNDGPVDLGSMVPQYLLSKAVKEQGFNVCLSGDGADELFGGYKRSVEYDSQYSDIYHELIYYHLPRLDKMMMANTVELRSPFLARNVIEAAMGVPYKDRINKQILKDLFGEYLPQEIIDRKKVPLRFNDGKDKITRRHELINKFRNLIWRPQDEYQGHSV